MYKAKMIKLSRKIIDGIFNNRSLRELINGSTVQIYDGIFDYDLPNKGGSRLIAEAKNVKWEFCNGKLFCRPDTVIMPWHDVALCGDVKIPETTWSFYLFVPGTNIFMHGIIGDEAPFAKPPVINESNNIVLFIGF